METVKLGLLIKKTKVARCGEHSYPVLSITKQDGIIMQSEKFKKRIASADTSDYKIIPRGKLVQGIHIDEGNFGIQDIVDNGIVSPAYGVWDVNDGLVIPKYLEMVLRSPKSIEFYRSKLTGTVNRRGHMSDADFLSMDIPLPDRDTQSKILKTMKQTTSVLYSRQQQLAKLDELIKARFVEMFENNTYPKVKVSTVCDFITKGTTPPNDLISEEYSSDKVPYLKVYNLSFNGELLFDTAPQYISENIHNGMLARSKVYPNDVLMNIVGPPLGKFSLVTDEFPEWNINQAIAIFRAKEKINPKYLLSALMQPEVLNPFLRQAVGIRQLNLSLSQCRDLEIFLPPLSLQNQFAAFVAEVDKSKLFAELFAQNACILAENRSK